MIIIQTIEIFLRNNDGLTVTGIEFSGRQSHGCSSDGRSVFSWEQNFNDDTSPIAAHS